MLVSTLSGIAAMFLVKVSINSQFMKTKVIDCISEETAMFTPDIFLIST